MKRKWELSRRTLLGGAGTLLALPVLEAMVPGLNRAHAQGTPSPRRLGIFYFPTGANMSAWRPSSTGTNFAFPQSLRPLETAGLRGDVTILSGLNNRPASQAGDQAGDFARHKPGVAALLTSTVISKSGLRNGVSVDQLAAKTLKQHTRLPSLELGTDNYPVNDSGEPGWNATYGNTVCWGETNNGLPKMLDPAAVFDRIFAGYSPDTTQAEAAKRKLYRQSVLDAVREDAKRLQTKVGKADQQKLEEYFTSVRDLEVQVQANAGTPPTGTGCLPGTRPTNPGISVATLPTRTKLMLDLMVLAFQCDQTRVATFMWEHTVVYKKFTFIDPAMGYYHIEVAHHGGNNTRLAYYAKTVEWLTTQFAYLANKMKAITEPTGGTLLDNSTLMMISELSDGNSHSHNGLPVVIAGKGGGKIPGGRHLSFSGEPIANLYISLLSTVGVNVTRFGADGTRLLPGFLA